jgi:hypothetical protein
MNINQLIYDACDMVMIGREEFNCSRKRVAVYTRSVVANILREDGWSFPKIAALVNDGPHSSAINWIRMWPVIARDPLWVQRRAELRRRHPSDPVDNRSPGASSEPAQSQAKPGQRKTAMPTE